MNVSVSFDKLDFDFKNPEIIDVNMLTSTYMALGELILYCFINVFFQFSLSVLLYFYCVKKMIILFAVAKES